jgi:hypothetical protein
LSTIEERWLSVYRPALGHSIPKAILLFLLQIKT